MTYDVFFAGAGAIMLGTLLGAWLSCRLTYGFQKQLLQQQLDFQKKQAEADAAQRKQIHDETLAVFSEFRDMLNTRVGRIEGHLFRLQPPP